MAVNQSNAVLVIGISLNMHPSIPEIKIVNKEIMSKVLSFFLMELKMHTAKHTAKRNVVTPTKMYVSKSVIDDCEVDD